MIRNIILKPEVTLPDTVVEPVDLFPDGSYISGEFQAGNIGGGTATITNSYCSVYWKTETLPIKRPYEGLPGNHVVHGTLKPGESATGHFKSEDPMDMANIRILEGSRNLWIFGWIEYRDDLNFVRRIAFCRQYDAKINRFVYTNDPTMNTKSRLVKNSNNRVEQDGIFESFTFLILNPTVYL
jgi:hypothetical protein